MFRPLLDPHFVLRSSGLGDRRILLQLIYMKAVRSIGHGSVKTARFNPNISSLKRNTLQQTFEEGTHFMIPWVERPIIYDVRAKPHTINSVSGSRDLQMVSVETLNLISTQNSPFSATLEVTVDQPSSPHVLSGEHQPSCAHTAEPQDAADHVPLPRRGLRGAGASVHHPRTNERFSGVKEC